MNMDFYKNCLKLSEDCILEMHFMHGFLILNKNVVDKFIALFIEYLKNIKIDNEVRKYNYKECDRIFESCGEKEIFYDEKENSIIKLFFINNLVNDYLTLMNAIHELVIHVEMNSLYEISYFPKIKGIKYNFKGEKYFSIEMEKFSTTLQQYLIDHLEKMDRDEMINILVQITHMIWILGGYGFSHRDLHFENIMIENVERKEVIYYYTDKNGNNEEIMLDNFGIEVKLIDFNLAFIKNKDGSVIEDGYFYDVGGDLVRGHDMTLVFLLISRWREIHPLEYYSLLDKNEVFMNVSNFVLKEYMRKYPEVKHDDSYYYTTSIEDDNVCGHPEVILRFLSDEYFM